MDLQEHLVLQELQGHQELLVLMVLRELLVQVDLQEHLVLQELQVLVVRQE